MKLKFMALLLAGTTLISGCGSESEGKATSTQVAAKVNGEEVTVHELNQMLRRVTAPVTKENEREVKLKVLDGLIDQTLVMQAAREQKLDRDPLILSALEEAKRKVLVDAYVQRTLQGVGNSSEMEVQAFYKENPDLYSNRKLFVFSQVTAPADKVNQEQLVEKIKSVKTLDEFADYLKAEGKDFKEFQNAKTSEGLPPFLLKSLNSIGIGDIGFVRMSDGLLIVSLEQVIPLPLTYDEAKGAIEHKLSAGKLKEAADKLLASLRKTAKIEYMGELAPAKEAK